MILGYSGLIFNDFVLFGIGDGYFWVRNYFVYFFVFWSVFVVVCLLVVLGVVGFLLINSFGLIF